jgi:hypothetical protein
MAINWVRGFRRIGWVVTFPVAGLIILALYEKTKEYSPTNYEVAETNWRVESALGGTTLRLVQVPGINFRWLNCPAQVSAYFSPDVPMDVVRKIVKDFAGKQEPPYGVYHVETDAGKNYVVDEMGNTIQWKFTVHKIINRLKLAGLVAGSVVIPGLVIQGFISIFAWILRGF